MTTSVALSQSVKLLTLSRPEEPVPMPAPVPINTESARLQMVA